MKNSHRTGCVLLLLFFAVLCPSCKHKDQPVVHKDVLVREDTGAVSDSLSFIVVGDWGRNGGEHQQAVADQMDVYARKFNVQFIISTGDNFYEEGVTSTDDPQWKTSFENIYNKPGHQVTWYATLGNHDYRSNPQAQVEYTGMSHRWKMPARYYTVQRKVDSSHNVLFVFTDTSPFVRSCYNFAGPNSGITKQDTVAQLSWLQNSLNSSGDSWKIVVGHHPVLSSGSHGSTTALMEDFKPLFSKSKTDFYLAGHDHMLGYLAAPEDPVHYLISGGGSEAKAVYQNPYSRFAKSSPGFLVMTLYADKANFYFYNEKGELLFSEQVKK